MNKGHGCWNVYITFVTWAKTEVVTAEEKT